MKLPTHNTSLPSRPVKHRLFYDTEDLRLQTGSSREVGLGYHQILRRDWGFNGPWFTGRFASLRSFLNIYSYEDINEGLSLFHPKALEPVVSTFLTQTYGGDFYNNAQEWLAPFNWTLSDHLPGLSATYEVASNPDSIIARRASKHLVFPVSQKHFMVLHLQQDWGPYFDPTTGEADLTKDDWINTSELDAMSNHIIDSVKFKPSPQVQLDIKDAQEGLDIKSLTKDFPPLKWEMPKSET